MNGLTVTILALLIFVKRYIAVYSDYTIVINSDRRIKVHGGQTVTASLAREKIFLPSACGGKGTCGFCQVQVIKGLVDPSSIEEAILTYKDISIGKRLGCQTKVRSDMEIEIPEDYLSVREFRGRVKSIQTKTHDIKRFDIDLLEPKEIEFKSGQYVVIEPIPGETRAYSIASLRGQKGEIALEVKNIPNGICSTYLHAMKENEELTFFGPYGEFYLRSNSHKVVCVAGGVGLAPMKSIIDEAANDPSGRQVELYYGARTIDDMYDYENFIELTKSYKNFQFFPALSEVKEIIRYPSGYVFATGFINQEIMAKLTDAENSEAYLCGPPIMIDTCIKTLIQKGIREEVIYYDKF